MGNVSTVDVKYIMSRDGVKRDSFIDKLRYDNEERDDDTQEKRYMYKLHVTSYKTTNICVCVWKKNEVYKMFSSLWNDFSFIGSGLLISFYNVNKQKKLRKVFDECERGKANTFFPWHCLQCDHSFHT